MPLVLATTLVVVERQWQSMGTLVTGTVEAGSREEGLAALQAVAAALDGAEALLSTWRSDTELSRLNAAPMGAPIPADPELVALLARSLGAARSSGGAFDPTVGRLVEAWGLRGRGRFPSDPELAAAREATGHWLLEVDASLARVTRHHPRVTIEEGAFGKGYGLEGARLALARAPGVHAAVIDLGGQVLVFGSFETVLAVGDPRHRDVAAAEIRLRAGSASTSGDSERGLVVDGRPLGHILDARSGTPARDFGSVTVVAPDAVLADILSTTLFVLGPEDGLAWLGGREDVAVLFLETTPDGVRGRLNRAMEPLLSWVERPDFCILDTSATPP